jgi:hypothetical protein
VKAEEAFGMGQPIEQRIKRVMVDGIPVQVLLLFVGIGLCLTASSDATVPAPVTPSLIAPAPSVVVHDKAGDAAAVDVDIRSVRVYRGHPYCVLHPCPEGAADGVVIAVFTLAKPVRNNATYSVFLTSGGKRFQLAAKRAGSVNSFFVFRFSDATKTDKFVHGFIRGRVISVYAALHTLGFGYKPFRFFASAEPTNGRRGVTDRAPNGSGTVRFTR